MNKAKEHVQDYDDVEMSMKGMYISTGNVRKHVLCWHQGDDHGSYVDLVNHGTDIEAEKVIPLTRQNRTCRTMTTHTLSPIISY